MKSLIFSFFESQMFSRPRFIFWCSMRSNTINQVRGVIRLFSVKSRYRIYSNLSLILVLVYINIYEALSIFFCYFISTNQFSSLLFSKLKAMEKLGWEWHFNSLWPFLIKADPHIQVRKQSNSVKQFGHLHGMFFLARMNK